MSRNPSPHTPQGKLNRSTPAASEVRLGDIINDLITTVNAVVADNVAMAAKLNADAGVTDTNYAVTAAAVTVLSLR
jgi:hypothetical protein